MNTINILLDKAKESCARKSDAAIAEALKVSAQTIMQWRKDERRITDEHLMAAIKLAKADPELAILIRLESAKTEAEKKAWNTLYKRLTATAATLLIGAGITYPKASQADALDKNFSNVISHNAYYVHVEKVGTRTAR
ncbi:DUF3693 domain-containing protein [Xylella fastidiosa]|uniref:DUF3693 domain-containing protein n=1 Tax=Xylella fastidiosa TaxID=2371 RepID=UPI0007334B8D|nr:DUF3693 domain-containing protein [Xylella fastidiosa]